MDSGSRGTISIQALWLLLIISFLAVGLAMRSSLSISLTRRSLQYAETDILARSLARVVRSQIAAADSLACENGGQCVMLPTHFEVNVHEGTFYLQVTPGGWPDDTTFSNTWDEEAKINLNTAPSFVLENLINDPILVAEINQYRRDFRLDESGPISAADSLLEQSARQAAFATVDDLLRLEGFTIEELKHCRPLLTTVGDGRLNINTVSPEVLGAAGCPQSLVNKLLEIRNSAAGSDETGPEYIFLDWELLPAELIKRDLEISTEEQNWLKLAQNYHLIGERSRYFSFCVTCGRGDEHSVSAQAMTIKRLGQGKFEITQEWSW